MKFAYTILLISFAGVAVFGFIAMGHNENDHMGCIASFAQRGTCPGATDAIAYIAFHLDALKSFSNAVFESAVSVGVLLTMLVFATFLHFLVRKRPLDSGIALTPSFLREKTVSLPVSPQYIIRWLSLHENSPSVA